MTYELSRNNELQKLNTIADNYCSRGCEQVSCVCPANKWDRNGGKLQRRLVTDQQSSTANQYLYQPFGDAMRFSKEHSRMMLTKNEWPARYGACETLDNTPQDCVRLKGTADGWFVVSVADAIAAIAAHVSIYHESPPAATKED